MKKILLIAVAATLALSSCNNNRRSAEAEGQDDPTGSVGAANPAPGNDSLNNPSKADSLGTDGYKADSVTQTYPIPR